MSRQEGLWSFERKAEGSRVGRKKGGKGGDRGYMRVVTDTSSKKERNKGITGTLQDLK